MTRNGWQKAEKSGKRCERCKRRQAQAGYRYCVVCKGAVLREMYASGYLTNDMTDRDLKRWKGEGEE